jgi:NarL family two-component system response regulator LiaR
MTEPRKIRVLLVDDHRMLRRGLVAFLSLCDDLEVVGEAGGGVDAICMCTQLRPDVVLMDVMMPDMDGAAATQAIRTQFPQIQVLALTSFADEFFVQRMLLAGAVGYLLKNVEADELADAIRAAGRGQSTLVPEAMQALLHLASRPSTPGSDLTVREREVLALLVKGLHNRQIAAQLMVSQSTIKGHVSNILEKLKVSSRTEAVALAVQHHLTD